MKIHFKEKKDKTFYGKRITPLLLIYILFICLCFASIIFVVTLAPDEQSDTYAMVGTFISLGLTLLSSGIMIFLVIPVLKKAQAKRDFARYNFDPYTPTDNETFECDYRLCRYTAAASPFDEDASVEFKTEEAAKEYLTQHFSQELLRFDEYYNGPEKSPFFISFYSTDKIGPAIRIDKKTDGERTTFDINEKHRATFTKEGIEVGGTVYNYSLLSAEVIAGFNKDTDYYVNVRLLIFLEDEGYLSFELSRKIAEVVKFFGIKVNNPETLKYILDDPAHAFEQTALQLGLRKLK